MKNTILPAIRSRVGDWNYYVTTLSFADVALLIKAPDEIHERKKLSSWIQRKVIEKNAESISNYVIKNEQRFLGAIIVGVYGGSPNWLPINIKHSIEESSDLAKSLEGSSGLGVLQFNGDEKLFAIDGQHRVAGIKLALKTKPDDEFLSSDSITALFVAHDPNNKAGQERTRRLFTTVNKKAKAVSKSARIALDEDDGYAITTRRLIDSHWLFEDERGHILYSSGGSIPAKDANSITSVVGLYEITRDLKGGDRNYGEARPSDIELDGHLALCTDYINTLLEKIPEYMKVFIESDGRPSDYRTEQCNHILFRPAGQRAFTRAVHIMLTRGCDIQTAVETLSKPDLYMSNKNWHHFLWDPVANTMITNRVQLAESQLLTLCGQRLRDAKSKASFDKLMKSILK